ncbi:MAG: YesL family protein, partial [Clostridiaceae bacterium]|nr:YesL family protein [Clostridiaceae bacterium]
MAGFFGLFDFTKEGPGVPKDAPPKSRFIIFFEVLARKFWNIVKINLLFVLFNLPAFLFFVLFTMYYNQLLFPQEVIDNMGGDLLNYLAGFTFPLMLILVCFPLITVGPAQAGMTYVLRNYSREEHAFIWGDFIEKAKNNFKQSMIVSIINTIVTILVMLDFYIYANVKTDNILFTIANSLIIVAVIVFMMMSMY